jgi:hypothetical protein
MQIVSPEPGPVHRRVRSSPAMRRTRTHRHRWKTSARPADRNRAGAARSEYRVHGRGGLWVPVIRHLVPAKAVSDDTHSAVAASSAPRAAHFETHADASPMRVK